MLHGRRPVVLADFFFSCCFPLWSLVLVKLLASCCHSSNPIWPTYIALYKPAADRAQFAPPLTPPSPPFLRKWGRLPHRPHVRVWRHLVEIFLLPPFLCIPRLFYPMGSSHAFLFFICTSLMPRVQIATKGRGLTSHVSSTFGSRD